MTERKSLILSYNRKDASDSLIIKDPDTRRVKAFDLKQNISSITKEFFKEESLYNGYVLFVKTFSNDSSLVFKKNTIYKISNGFFENFPDMNSKPFKSFQDVEDFFNKNYWELVEIKSNPPFYNGKILFLEDLISLTTLIKKNKIYKVKNGIFRDEENHIVPYLSYTYPFVSFEDIQNYFSSKGRIGIPYNSKAGTTNHRIIEVQE